MRPSLRSFKRNWHMLLGTRKCTIDGIWVSTDKNTVPRFVRSLIYRGTYEDTERELIRKVLKPDSRVLEIGCGIGLVSLVAKSICTKGVVRSYEANPEMEKLIRENYALNGLEPDLVMKAVTVDGGNIDFFVDTGVLSSSTINRGRNDNKTTVQSDALDHVLEDLKPETIIMDVEGAELSLLGQSTLQGVRNIVVEMHPHIVGADAIESLIAKLAEAGFSVSERRGKVYLLRR